MTKKNWTGIVLILIPFILTIGLTIYQFGLLETIIGSVIFMIIIMFIMAGALLLRAD